MASGSWLNITWGDGDELSSSNRRAWACSHATGLSLFSLLTWTHSVVTGFPRATRERLNVQSFFQARFMSPLITSFYPKKSHNQAQIQDVEKWIPPLDR